MVTLETLNAASDEDFLRELGGIYEHSEWVASKVMGQRPFRDLSSLASAMRQTVDRSDLSDQLKLIRNHPDLAGKLARAGDLTAASTREQSELGLDRLEEDEFVQFSKLNADYHLKFGFPFVICARLTTRQGMLDAFDRRLKGNGDSEVKTAIHEIHEIARLRLKDLVRDLKKP